MNRNLATKSFLTVVVVGLCVPAAAERIDRSKLYQKIVDRNPFGLNPPPPPAPPEPEEAPPEEVKVNLTGFSMRNDRKRVHLMIPPDAASSTPRYYTLSENDRQGSLEIVSIDVENESVRVRNAGKLATLTFDSNGLQAAASKGNTRTARTAATTTRARSATKATASNTSRAGSSARVIGRGGVNRNETATNTGNTASASVASRINSLRAATSSLGSANRSIPSRASSRYSGRNRQVHTAPTPPFQGRSGEDIAAQQIIAAEAQRLQNPQVQYPPIPMMPSAMQAPPQGNGQ